MCVAKLQTVPNHYKSFDNMEYCLHRNTQLLANFPNKRYIRINSLYILNKVTETVENVRTDVKHLQYVIPHTKSDITTHSYSIPPDLLAHLSNLIYGYTVC